MKTIQEKMSATDSGKKQFRSNKAALNITWFILIVAVSLLLISMIILNRNNHISKTNIRLHSLIENQQIAITEITTQLSLAIESNGLGSLPFKTEVLEKLTATNTSVKEIHGPSILDGFDDTQKTELERLTLPLKNNINEFNGIVKLILDKKKGVSDNQQIIKNQLFDSQKAYFKTLSEIKKWSLEQLSESNNFIYQYQWLTTVAYLLLALLGYLKIIKPLGTSFKETTKLIEDWKTRVADNDQKLASVIQQEKTNALFLKTKIAQVQKLQESLEMALTNSNKAKQEKNLVYFNAATDISGFINVMNMQREIIENQTDLGKNNNWVILTGSISQLESLVGDYFNRAKIGFSHQNQSEIYLSQLLSEILLSMANNEGIVFEQVSDMPTIKTNATLFKRVIQPYFEMIANCKNNGKIKISAIENGVGCELKFIGLSPLFQEKWKEMEAKELVDLSFDEFKIHMSKNAINERGGSQWLQFDQGNTGVFHINWVL